jgi:hypothetical protein
MVKNNQEFRESVILIDLYPSETRRHMGGANNCAFGSRHEVHNSNIIIQYREPQKDREAQEKANRFVELFKSLDHSPDQIQDAPRYAGYDSNLTGRQALGQMYERVRKVKGRYDPENVFNKWIKIEPTQ